MAHNPILEAANALLAKVDPELHEAIQAEQRRQRDYIELIASENYASAAVLAAQGSVLTNKYAKVIPGRVIMAAASCGYSRKPGYRAGQKTLWG